MSVHERSPVPSRTGRVARGLWLACGLALLPLGAGCRRPVAQAAPPPPTVGVVEARRMTVPLRTTATGTTRALQEVAIRARVRGFLTEQHFEEGSFVEQGQLLFVIDEAQYKVALQQARSKLADAQARLRSAQGSKAVPVAEATLAVSRARLATAQLDEARGRQLSQRGVQTREELDRQQAALDAARAEVQAREADRLQAEVDFQSGIELAQAAVQAAQAEVDAAALNLSYCRMESPIAGRIGEAKVKVGNLVGPASPGGPDNTELASVQQLDPMGVDVRVSSRYLERWAHLIAEGLETRLLRPGLDGEASRSYEGQVYFYDNLIDPTTSTFLVKARVPNPDATLLPGEYVKLETTIGALQDAVVVPEQAVIATQAGMVVYALDREGKVAMQKVEATQTYEGLRVIAAGLEPGRAVIVEGLQLARPGLPVKAEPAHLAAPARAEGPAAAADARAPAPAPAARP
jgi:membrane fusion protein (multidrug efflux system)